MSPPESEETIQEVELRPLLCELNVLTRADGSAMLTQGNTTVIAAMYGPVSVKVQNLQTDKAFVEVNFRPKAGIPNVGDRLKETVLRNTCEIALLSALHPRSSVSIVVQEMQDCGGLIASSINAACLALLNSGYPMKFLLAAVYCIIDQNNKLIVDPNQSLSQDSSLAVLTFAFDSVQKMVVASHTVGKFTALQYLQGERMCREASITIFEFYRNIVRKYASVI